MLLLCIRSKNSQASFVHVGWREMYTFIFSYVPFFVSIAWGVHFLWIKGIAQLYVANIVQDADTQFVFAIKKIFLKFLHMVQNVAAIIHLRSTIICKSKLFKFLCFELLLAMHIDSNNILGLFGQRILRHLSASMGFNAIVYHSIIFLSTLNHDVACCFVPRRRLSLIEWFPTAENPSFCRFWCCRRSIYIVNKARFQAWITHIRKFLCYFNYDAD